MRLALLLLFLLLAGCGRGDRKRSTTAADVIDLLARPWAVATFDGSPLDSEGISSLDLTSSLRATQGLEEPSRSNGKLSARATEDAEGRWSASLLGLHATQFDSLSFVFESHLPIPVTLELRYGDGESLRETVIAGGVGSLRQATIIFPPRFRGLDVRPNQLAFVLPSEVSGDVGLSKVRLHSNVAATRTTTLVAGRSLRAIEIRPGYSVRWNARLPRNARLSFASAVAERAWKSHGDGSFLNLDLIDEQGTQHQLWSRALAPGQNPGHRDWFEEDLDLSAFAGQEIQLRFSSSATAPVRTPFERSGDPSDDAALFGVPRIYRTDNQALNVLVLLIDSLRADRLSLYGYPRNVDPHLSQLARESVLYERAYAPAPWTVPSTASLLTGLYPNLHGKGIVRGDRTRFREEAFFLAEAVRNAGYRTGIMSNNPLIVPSNGFDRGIDEFDVRANEDGWYYGGERLSSAATEWLDRHPTQPFFLYVHYFDPHYPYQAPPGRTRSYVDAQLASAVHDERILAGDANDARRRIVARSKGLGSGLPPQEHVDYLEALYDAETRYADEMIGRLLEALALRKLLERTLVIVTSDHGEEFLEHGFLTHGHSLYEELLHVPLIIRFPDETGRGERIDIPVSLVDVAPTVLSFLGLPMPTTPILSGRDLYGPTRRRDRLDPRPIFAHSAGAGKGTGLAQHGPKRAVIDWPLKLIDDIDGPSVVYHLERDPKERRWREFAKEHGPERRRQLEALADSALALPDNWRGSLEEMSPQLLRDLRALGYVE